MAKKPRLKFKYRENEESFRDEIKSILYHFQKAFIEANKTNIFWKMRVQLYRQQKFISDFHVF